VARLLVFRGETLDREVEVGREPIRIGRGEQNDLRLADVGKAVSRHHAEIRFEDGQYVLVDLNSQNGIWVSGRRVPVAVFGPKVVASLGPYRLMLDVDPPTASDLVIPGDASVDSPTEFVSRPTGAVKKAEPKGQPAPIAAVPPPAAPPAAQKSVAKTAEPAKPSQVRWLVGGAALLVAIGVAIAVARFARTPPVPEPSPVVALLADARRLIDQGECQRALNDAIGPALAAEPTNSEALTLKTQAGACVAPSPAPPGPRAAVPLTTEEISEHLRLATDAVSRQECAAALTEHISKVLDQEPANPEAVQLKQQAEVCPPPAKEPVAPAPATRKLAVRTAPENGGLEPLSGEQDKDYQLRIRAMRARYDEAVATLESGTYPRAIQALEGIAREAGGRYLAVAAKLGEARKGAAGLARADAREFEAKDDYDQAIGALRRAAAADPELGIDDDIKRLQDKKTQAGLNACDQAKNAYAFNRMQQALQLYQQVIRLLPPDHACSVVAKERIASIGR